MITPPLSTMRSSNHILRRRRPWRNHFQSQLPSGEHHILPIFGIDLNVELFVDELIHAGHHGGASLFKVATGAFDKLLYILLLVSCYCGWSRFIVLLTPHFLHWAYGKENTRPVGSRSFNGVGSGAGARYVGISPEPLEIRRGGGDGRESNGSGWPYTDGETRGIGWNPSLALSYGLGGNGCSGGCT
jgi:hypothetical protein